MKIPFEFSVITEDNKQRITVITIIEKDVFDFKIIIIIIFFPII